MSVSVLSCCVISSRVLLDERRSSAMSARSLAASASLAAASPRTLSASS
eukprot:CAMPEP_0113692360 /NCGR_PEP_ID=MMETSP0038_2-20120614/19037_1 /TAXON_ID=2898 /ORGANISM="Cryptomonas paramecium" /LENGTH=48 /DNA_ID=CAMNT_0000614255 /DNA_START=379 /DNA_END=521 /DNA_ORIENTATION=+ /assembly_acc=CAM_ASM_000170